MLYSGDIGFYSGARALLPLLKEAGISFQVLPGLSSVQLLAAALGRPWQDWLLVSAHGTDCDPVGAVMQGRPVFFLTGGELGPAELCQKLARAGLGDLPVTVGEELSYPGQQVRRGTAGDFAEERFSPLSVLLAEPAPGVARRAPGFPDSWFLRGEAPMTKREVRAAILARLDPRPGEVFWDVGAGTGSVSIELALAASRGRAYAIECGEAACGLIRQNRERLGAWNLQVVQGHAPQALEGLETAGRGVYRGHQGRAGAGGGPGAGPEPPGQALRLRHLRGDPVPGGQGPGGSRHPAGDRPGGRQPGAGGRGPAPAAGPQSSVFDRGEL